MFGARIGARNERKVLFLRGIQRERLAGKVQPGEARFGLELNGGKAWRSRLPGASEGGYEHGVEGTKCWECRASGGGLWSCVGRAAREWEPASCHGWRSCGRCRDNSQAEVGCQIGTWGHVRHRSQGTIGSLHRGARGSFWIRCSGPGLAQEMKEKFFF